MATLTSSLLRWAWCPLLFFATAIPVHAAAATLPEEEQEPGTSADAVAHEEEQGEKTPSAPIALVGVDPLGFLLFGPNVTAEARLGKFGVGASFRWFSPGLLAKALFLGPGDRFGLSYGAALRSHFYFLRPLAGPHVGLAAEILHTRVKNERDGYVAISTYLVPQIEAGYRLSARRFFVGGVAGFGYAARLESRIEPAADGFSVINESSVYGSARLDLGVYF